MAARAAQWDAFAQARADTTVTRDQANSQPLAPHAQQFGVVVAGKPCCCVPAGRWGQRPNPARIARLAASRARQ
eukprot:9796758-Alexandrium_andersonii.AAC.1